MGAWALVLAAGALLMWPTVGGAASPLGRLPGAARRLPASVVRLAGRPDAGHPRAARRSGRGARGALRRDGRPGRLAVRGALPVAVLVMAVAGPVCAAAAAIITATAILLGQRAILARRHRHDLTDCAAGLRMLVRELRAGAAPAAACTAAAGSATGVAALVLAALTATTHWGLETAPDPEMRGIALEVAVRLRNGWLLSVRHGVPWADVVGALAADVENRARTDTERAAEVAGPTFSGYVLAALPALGLLLGAGMGADPVAVLFGSAVGHLLLLAGTVLSCAGLLWAARIVGG